MRLRDPRKYFLLDEIVFNVSMRPSYGWAQGGERANVTVGSIRSRNISDYATMSKSGLFYFVIQDCAYDGDYFLLYLQSLFEYFRQHDIAQATLVMDNVSFHKKKVSKIWPDLSDAKFYFYRHIHHSSIQSKICLPNGRIY